MKRKTFLACTLLAYLFWLTKAQALDWRESYKTLFNHISQIFNSMYEDFNIAQTQPPFDEEENYLDAYWKEVDSEINSNKLFRSEEFIQDLHVYYEGVSKVCLLWAQDPMISPPFFDKQQFDQNVQRCKHNLQNLVNTKHPHTSLNYFQYKKTGLTLTTLDDIQKKFSEITLDYICEESSSDLCLAISKSIFSHSCQNINYFWKKYRKILPDLKF